MNPWHSLVLGIVQGVTEFLPISSSGHLVLVPWLLGWPAHRLTYDVALHMGTLGALLAYFWRDWWRLIAAWLPKRGDAGARRRAGAETRRGVETWRQRDAETRRRGDAAIRGREGPVIGDPKPAVRGPAAEAGEAVEGGGDGGRGGNDGGEELVEEVVEAARTKREERALERRLGLSIVIATVPAALIGALVAERVEQALRLPALIGVLTVVAAVLLAAADRAGLQRFGLEAVGYSHAVIVGLAQALALAPGVSRSGVTLAAALFLGLTREAAARFAFLMAAPITAGAGLFQLRHLIRSGLAPDEQLAFAIGVVTSFLVGVLSIGWLLRYLRTRSLDVFIAYRVGLGLLVLLVAALQLR